MLVMSSFFSCAFFLSSTAKCTWHWSQRLKKSKSFEVCRSANLCWVFIFVGQFWWNLISWRVLQFSLSVQHYFLGQLSQDKCSGKQSKSFTSMRLSIDSTFDAKDMLGESSRINPFVLLSLDGWSLFWIVESLLFCKLILFPFIFGMLQSMVERGCDWFNGEKKYDSN